ncbi:uncharacterized protein LOC134217328 isoform X1 [Armigeres subalbatus]|uniref:uncharacterized protein LOC134217328 isoform X1 n=1 Tax=Armigeres subalbatus TaxID=124917 RepID=UPI002ED0B4BB
MAAGTFNYPHWVVIRLLNSLKKLYSMYLTQNLTQGDIHLARNGRRGLIQFFQLSPPNMNRTELAQFTPRFTLTMVPIQVPLMDPINVPLMVPIKVPLRHQQQRLLQTVSSGTLLFIKWHILKIKSSKNRSYRISSCKANGKAGASVDVSLRVAAATIYSYRVRGPSPKPRSNVILLFLWKY